MKKPLYVAGVGLFIVIGKVPFPQLAENFIATLPKIKRFVEQHPRPFIAKIYRPDEKARVLQQNQSGRVEIWESYSS